MNRVNLSRIILCFIVILVGLCAKSYAQNQRNSASISVYTTASDTKNRLSLTNNLTLSNVKQPLENEICIFVDPTHTFQTLLGIGGAISDASAEVFAKLSKEKQQELLTAYYDNSKGIGYNLLRTTIHSSDFSSASYTYVKEGDKELTSFNIAHDLQYRIPMIKQVMKIAQQPFTLYASPWSPPAFMKTNKNMLKGGSLLPEFYQSWANYYVKFIKAYEKEGMPVWGITVQNEPMAVQAWESCIYTAEQERDFLKNYLGPTLEKEGLGGKKIIVWDHNRDLIVQRANVIFDDPEASKYAWGVGFHWYENWSGGEPIFDNVKIVQDTYPQKNIIFTEGCVERFDSLKYQYWGNAERYGLSMIKDFNAGSVGWTDWNILLDQTGGPNHVGNFCFSPIHANTTHGNLIYTPSYYYIGHFSKFIRPDAKRVSSSSSRSSLLTTSFINPDGTIATVVMNKTQDKINYQLRIKGQKVNVIIPPHAIQTLVYSNR